MAIIWPYREEATAVEEYKTPYFIMLSASEKALRAMEAANYGIARECLIRAQQEAEECILAEEEGIAE